MSHSDNARPPRVRVTGPHTERPRSRPRHQAAAEIDAQSELGAIYLSGLLRSQLRLAVITTLVLAVTIGGLPVLFHLAPGLGNQHVLGMPVPWVILAFACYPLMVLIAWRYVRASERQEDAFVQVVAPSEPGT